MICSYCKVRFPDDFKWCMECGTSLDADAGQFSAVGVAIREYQALNIDASTATVVAMAITQAACPSCGAIVNPSEGFCGECGTNLSGQVLKSVEASHVEADDELDAEICPKCGEDLEEGSRFCGSCGHNLDAVPALAPVAAPAPRIPAPAPEPPALELEACPNCGSLVDSEEAFCGECGQSLKAQTQPAPAPPSAFAEPVAAPDVLPCSNCGMDVAVDEAFCGSCGTASPHEGAPAPSAPLIEVTPAIEPPSAAFAGRPTATCPTCGMGVTEGDIFCGNCGASVNRAGEGEVPKAAALETGAAPAGQGKECPVCNTKNEAGAAFCETCGTEFEGFAPDLLGSAATDVSGPQAFCDVCGSANIEGDAFCGNCGSLISHPAHDGFAAPGSEPVSASQEGPRALICRVCGCSNQPGDSFCGECGAKLG